MHSDKQTEYLRYDARAQSLLTAVTSAVETATVFGALAVPPIYRAPYNYYEQCIRCYISKDHDVLELGAGTGLHTYALAQTGARVVARYFQSRAGSAFATDRGGDDSGCGHGIPSVRRQLI